MPISVEALNTPNPATRIWRFARFEFDEEIGMFTGDVVHHEFQGIAIPERQHRIWHLIREAFGEEAQQVSLVLTFSPVEWQEITSEAA